MSLETVRVDLAHRAPDLDIIVTKATTETVMTAAKVHGVEPGQIAKSLCIRVKQEEILLVTRGDARLDNKKSKQALGGRPRMLSAEDVMRLTSHEIGGVCPFGLPAPLKIFLDVSLKSFEELIPAAGSINASVRLPLERLVELTNGTWVDACQMRDG